MKKILPALVCGFGAGVLTTVPLIKSFSCCLIIPLASILSLVLDQRSNGYRDYIMPSKAVALGLLSGIFAAIFGSIFEILIVFILKDTDITAGLPAIKQMLSQYASNEMFQEMMDLLYKMTDDISKYGFSFIYTISILFSSLFINSIMGVIGGLIGMQILNNKLKSEE